MKRSGARTRTGLGLLSLAGLLSCTEAQEPSPDNLVAAGPPLNSVAAPAPPEAPRFEQCPEGFDAEGTGEALRCLPGWKVLAPQLSECPAGWKLGPVGTKAQREVCLPAAPAECPAGQRRDLSSAACVPGRSAATSTRKNMRVPTRPADGRSHTRTVTPFGRVFLFNVTRSCAAAGIVMTNRTTSESTVRNIGRLR